MEVSALRYSGGIGLHGRSPLLRLQSDERLIALVRRGNSSAFEVLVSRYHSRLLAFCRHLLGSKEDAEDVLQEVLAAAFNAILADERAINVRPWLYRIARNRSLNHLRRIHAIGVDSMDVHFSENGASTADKVHDREQFRLLVGDIQSLPETQRTALVLREMDALSYEQIAEAMDTTVPGVKSLLVRARISLAEAAEARQLSCDEVRVELAEVAEGLSNRPSPLVRRHLRSCRRCASFQNQLKHTNRALAALLPIGPVALIRQLLIVHLGHSAGTGSGATAAGATGATSAGAGAGATGVAAGQAAAVASTAGGASALGSAGGLISAGAGALATKAAAGLAAAALVTAGAVEASHVVRPRHHSSTALASVHPYSNSPSGGAAVVSTGTTKQAAVGDGLTRRMLVKLTSKHHHHHAHLKLALTHPAHAVTSDTATKGTATTTERGSTLRGRHSKTKKDQATTPGRTVAQTDPTVLSSPAPSTQSPPTTTTAPTNTTPSSTTPTDTSATGSSTAASGSGSSTNGWGSPTGTTTTTATSADPTSSGATTTPGSTTPTTSSDGSTTTTPGTGTSTTPTDPGTTPSPTAGSTTAADPTSVS